jgi:hypothetical protein
VDADLVEDPLADIREELSEAKEEIAELRGHLGRVMAFIAALRSAVNGGQQFAQPEPGGGPPQPIPSEAYTAWKQRLPPSCGRVIDALLVQPMNFQQIKNFCKMGASTLDQALAKLRANALIEKDGSLNRLKRL